MLDELKILTDTFIPFSKYGKDFLLKKRKVVNKNAGRSKNAQR